jgi:hypothetical protein
MVKNSVDCAKLDGVIPELHRAIATRCVSRLAPVTLVASGNSDAFPRIDGRQAQLAERKMKRNRILTPDS